jgi:hypothetical protein
VGPSDSGDTPETAEDSNFRAIYSTVKYLADRLTANQLLAGEKQARRSSVSTSLLSAD